MSFRSVSFLCERGLNVGRVKVPQSDTFGSKGTKIMAMIIFWYLLNP